jgi:cobalt-zinc-cadmium efflux system membrane fusion protein
VSRAAASWVAAVLACSIWACSSRTSEHGEEHGEHAEHGEEHHAEGVIELEPAMLERIDLRTEPVSSRVLPLELQTTGQVDFEQDRLAHVTPRIPGRVERVEADLGDSVRAGQVLAGLPAGTGSGGALAPEPRA